MTNVNGRLQYLRKSVAFDIKKRFTKGCLLQVHLPLSDHGKPLAAVLSGAPVLQGAIRTVHGRMVVRGVVSSDVPRLNSAGDTIQSAEKGARRREKREPNVSLSAPPEGTMPQPGARARAALSFRASASPCLPVCARRKS